MAHGKKRNWIALTKPWCRKQERAGEQKKKDSSEVFLVYFRFSLVSLFSLFSAFHSLNFKMITWGKRKTSNNQNEMLSSKMENRTMDNNESKRWAHTHTHILILRMKKILQRKCWTQNEMKIWCNQLYARNTQTRTHSKHGAYIDFSKQLQHNHTNLVVVAILCSCYSLRCVWIFGERTKARRKKIRRN